MATLLQMTRGDDVEFNVVVTDQAGDPVDLTGIDLRFTAKRDSGDGDDDAIIVKTTGAGITVTDEAGGLATISIDAADTDELGVPASLTWDLQSTDEAAKVRTLAGGTLAISPDVSRTAP